MRINFDNKNHISFNRLWIDKSGQKAVEKMNHQDLKQLNDLGNDIKVKISSYYDIVFSKDAELFLQPKNGTMAESANIFNLFNVAKKDNNWGDSLQEENIELKPDGTIQLDIIEPKYGVLGSKTLAFEEDIDPQKVLNNYLKSQNKFEKIKNLLVMFELAEQYETNKNKTINEKLIEFYA